MYKVIIIENSFLAKLCAKKLKVINIAVTIGNTIYLHNATKQELLDNKRWICHELVHVKQYINLVKFKFLFLYIIESIKNGYTNNRFEIEARNTELDTAILDEFEFE